MNELEYSAQQIMNEVRFVMGGVPGADVRRIAIDKMIYMHNLSRQEATELIDGLRQQLTEAM